MNLVANVLFLDQPANTGFSYATTPNAARFTDLEACNHVYDFLQKGYILGNPVTFPAQKNYSIPFAHGMGLVSSELYKSIAENCKEEFEFEEMDGVKNDLCSQELKVFKQMISGINPEHVLEPVCESQFILLNSGGVKFFNKGTTRSLSEKKLNMQWCRGKYHDLSTYWANDISVQEALHVRKGSIEQWLRCRSIIFPSAYTVTTRDSRQYHANLSRRGYASLIFSGDHDMKVPFQSTEAWIKELNYTITKDWRPWIVNDQIAGYTRSYSNQMTFATVKGAGHVAFEYKHEECAVMLTRWLSQEPL
ncbi:unnamed protein product [Cuscuta epithymum]|uniref:Uncharacterized protein n=1 Tax=Cuscuta epithymum TaxID=186058 RepID=A0AAV0EBA7_9ASTE|nr:unnamed protein product [Cuscuta epithymum]